MHAVTRLYSGPGAREVFDVIAEKKDDVETQIRGVPGFRAYTVFRTADGGVSVTVCDDKAGTDESNRRAAEWIRTNAPGLRASPPDSREGEVILNLV